MAFPDSISSGFNFDEAKFLLEVAQQTYNNTPNIPTSNISVPCPIVVPPPPGNWQIVNSMTPTETTLLDNFWQVWQNQDKDKTSQYVIAIRGTVDTTPSIIADITLPLIKARIDIDNFPFGLHLARQEDNSPVVAGVHAGFLLSLLLMLLTTDKPLAATLSNLACIDGAEVYLTGHSQGASIAILLTSLVRHSTDFFKGPTNKTYVFAPAKPGNDHYAYDYDRIAGEPGFGFSVINTQDWVPQIPLTLQGLSTVNRPNVVYEFSGQLNPAIPTALQNLRNAFDAAVDSVRDDIENALKAIVQKIEGELDKATFTLTTADLGMTGDAQPLGSSIVSTFLSDVFDQILLSLNFAKAGVLVPVFADPGPNPDDATRGQFDPFWQHHLCNYLFYFEQQYRPS